MEIITQHICKESDVGNHGNMFGGILMSWLDEAAAILAMTTAQSTQMVTVLADKIRFIEPIKVGDIVQILGKVEKIGTTSITMFLEAISVDSEALSKRKVGDIRMVFVNIDKWGKKTPIKVKHF